jgi:N-acetylmuramoyl-L-alanine amidase
MTIIEDWLPKDCKARPGIPIGKIESITIHWIGNYPSQAVKDPRNWWEISKGEAGAHFVVKDDTVLTAIPIDEVAYHCGVPVGNKSSIGIEVIPADHTGVFSVASVNTLRELLRELPNVPLKRHYDWSRKDCPLYYTPYVNDGNEHWNQLLKELGHESDAVS